MVPCVGNVDGPVGCGRHPAGLAELARPVAGARTSPNGEHATVGRELLDAVVLGVGDEQVAVTIEGKGAGRGELAWSGPRRPDHAPSGLRGARRVFAQLRR